MYPLLMMGAIHHAFIIAVVSFFVLFTASKADGFVKILGMVLGYLLLIAAALWIVCAVVTQITGHPLGMDGVWGMHQHMGRVLPPPGK